MRLLILLSALFTILWLEGYGQYGQVKTALKLQNKRKLEKAIGLIEKAKTKSDTLPAVLYAEARLLFDSAAQEFDLDLAYSQLLAGKSNFNLLDEKEMEKHAKIGADLTQFDLLKKRIESAAFHRALDQNTVKDYHYFLDYFQNTQYDNSATANRDSLAFLLASEINTYESYNEFMSTYPEARQVSEAKKRYERLYFNKSTADGKLESYVSFLNKYPGTEYRNDAEQRIFEILTAGNTTNGFRKFISAYPKSKLVSKAAQLAFHIAGQAIGPNVDSLEHVKQLNAHELIAINEDGRYGFINPQGEEIISPTFNYIGSEYLCQPLLDDFIITHNHVIARNGNVIFEGGIQSVTDIGLGILKIASSTGIYAVHKSGWKISPKSFIDIKIIGQFVGYNLNNRWGLMTLAGLELTPPRFSEISNAGDFYIFQQDERYDILNGKTIAESANNEPINFGHVYTDYEVWGSSLIWLETEYGQTLFDENLNEVIPFNTQSIFELEEGYAVEKENNITFYNSAFETGPSWNVSSSFYNKEYAVLNDSSSSQLLALKSFESLVKCDSIVLLGDYFAYSYANDTTSFFFKNGAVIQRYKIDEVNLLSNSSAPTYLAIKSGKKWQVFNTDGTLTLEEDYDDLTPVGKEYLVLTKGEKKGLYNNIGAELLPTKYAAIANYADGYISFFSDQKFGIVNDSLGIRIDNDYDKNIRAYNNSFLIVNKNAKEGLVDTLGYNITPLAYEEIVYWNDTSALVRSEFQWRFLDLKTNALLGEPLKSFTWINNSEDKVIVALIENRYGVFSNQIGEVIPPTFNDIINVGSSNAPVYFAEKHVEEADFYIVIYYNAQGELIRKQVFEADEYTLIYCED